MARKAHKYHVATYNHNSIHGILSDLAGTASACTYQGTKTADVAVSVIHTGWETTVIYGRWLVRNGQGETRRRIYAGFWK